MEGTTAPVTEPRAGAEPTVVAAQPGTGTPGATPTVAPNVEAIQAEAAKWKAEAENWKKAADERQEWHRLFTKSNQTGQLALAKELVPEGTTIDDAKRQVERVRQALALEDEIQKLGGMDTYREVVEVLQPVAQPAAAPPAPTTPIDPSQYIRKEEIEAVGRRLIEEVMTENKIKTAKADMATAVAKDLGLEAPSDRQLRLIRANIEAELSEVAGGRQPTAQEIQEAGQRVMELLFTPVRASAATLGTPKAGVPIPPTANARGVGAQQPPKPLAAMTQAERQQYAQQVIRDSLRREGLDPDAVHQGNLDPDVRFV